MAFVVVVLLLVVVVLLRIVFFPPGAHRAKAEDSETVPMKATAVRVMSFLPIFYGQKEPRTKTSDTQSGRTVGLTLWGRASPAPAHLYTASDLPQPTGDDREAPGHLLQPPGKHSDRVGLGGVPHPVEC